MSYSELLPFSPAPWAPDRHTQTILGDLLPSKPIKYKGERLIVDCSDGDQLLCRLFKGQSHFVICLFHGLTGDASAGYMQRIGKMFIDAGHTVCLVNHRNCGEGFGLARKPYHAGSSEDLARVIYDLRQIMPSKTFFSVGFSMSGNANLLLASGVVPTQKVYTLDDFKEKKELLKISMPDFVLSVNPPVNLEGAQESFKKSFNQMYQWNFVRQLKQLSERFEDKKIFEPIIFSYRTTLKELDEHYTSKRSGFNDASDYYDQSGAWKYLEKIKIPTMVLTSQDDPIVDYMHFDRAKKSSSIRWHYPESGGHMGYLHKQKLPHGSFRWMDYAVFELFKQMTR